MKKILLLMTVLIMTSLRVSAITGGFIPDGASLEAMIANHKVVGAALDVRAIAEVGVLLAHDSLRTQVKSYEELKNELDKYYRCFDIIDLVFKGSATALHHYTAFQTISHEVKDYKDLLASYEKNILLKGAVWSTDTTVFHTTIRCVSTVGGEAADLKDSYVLLAGLIAGTATGTYSSKTSNLMACLTDINDHLNNITEAIRQAHYYLLGYMTMRLGFNSRELLQAGDLNDIIRAKCRFALSAWQKAAHKAAENNKQGSSGKSLGSDSLAGHGGLIGATVIEETSLTHYKHLNNETYLSFHPRGAVVGVASPCPELC